MAARKIAHTRFNPKPEHKDTALEPQDNRGDALSEHSANG